MVQLLAATSIESEGLRLDTSLIDWIVLVTDPVSVKETV